MFHFRKEGKYFGFFLKKKIIRLDACTTPIDRHGNFPRNLGIPAEITPFGTRNRGTLPMGTETKIPSQQVRGRGLCSPPCGVPTYIYS
jgi:hypothetical protein